MRKYVDTNQPLKTNHRNMLSVAYKNVVGALRSSWRILKSSSQSDAQENYLKRIQDELVVKCYSVIVSCLIGENPLSTVRRQGRIKRRGHATDY